jgi:hypothetical protein
VRKPYPPPRLGRGLISSSASEVVADLVGLRFLHLLVRSLVAEVGKQYEIEQLRMEAAELAGVACGHLLMDAGRDAAGDDSGQVRWES